MIWKKIRIDFTETVKCEFCNRKITSGKGIVIQNENGIFSFAGPSCAQNEHNVINPKESIMDITKGCELHEIERKPSSAKSIKLNKDNNEDNFTKQDDIDSNDYLDTNAVKAYLTLRFGKLGHIESIPKADRLNKIYESFITSGKILEQDERYISVIMYGDKYPRFTYRNLQAVYAAEFWLMSFIKNHNSEKSEFMKSILQYLRSNLYLTPKQINAVNNWFTYSDGKQIKLKSNAFEK